MNTTARRVRRQAALMTLLSFAIASPVSAACLWPPGDVTFNHKTDIVDVQCSILTSLASISGGAPPSCLSGPLETSDANCDAQVTVSDVMVIIQTVLGALPGQLDPNGNGCPDVCEAPCVAPVVGGCPGCVYPNSQCDPLALECGKGAMLADLDCDCHFDVCQMCPTGGHAADLDADACDDACVCCLDIPCAPGQIPYDSDDDGCVDMCLCHDAVIGQCFGFDYSDQCDPKGLDCGPFGILADPNCDGIYEVCALCPPGTHPVDTTGDGCEDVCDCCPKILCKPGFVPLDSDGDGCPDICIPECSDIVCQPGQIPYDSDGDGCADMCLCHDAVLGQCPGFDYTAQCDPDGFDCGPFAILADLDCDGKYEVCALCPDGTHPVDTNGDGCEDVCDCCDPIPCGIHEIPYDSDGDGCVDMCVCDEAIFGQCAGFDYTDQCDPDGYDCGPNAILADLDCDGIYEVCGFCPPGTHAVDPNGDGCEDVCDCCEPLVCPIGFKGQDSDGDGCADTCVPECSNVICMVGQIPYDSDGDGCTDMCLCGDAVLGQCPGFDYTDQCDPDGFDCGPFSIFADLDCDGQYEVCAFCPDGTHAVDTNGDGCEDVCDCCQPFVCAFGHIPYDSDDDGCPDLCVCDKAVFGQCPGFDYADQCDPTGLDCGPDAIFGDSDCDGQYDVCVLCPPGTHPMDTKGDGCEDICGCCKPFVCPVGFVPKDTDGDGCPDTCVPGCDDILCMPGQIPYDSDGDGCADMCLCHDAVLGQCPGFDYTDQCDPDGWDCGPFGILGDLDCDGIYEVCLECPAGTHPVDTNGDGCEDVCDCCPPLLCPKGYIPYDSDDDMCPDLCVCDDAVFGQCPGFDYSDQCDPTGLDCGPFGILADPNCDGIYEVCAICPEGTHPVDTSGDGCEDICDCCPKIVCAPGYHPVDGDGDGCADHCVPDCLGIVCLANQIPYDSNGDGCADMCLCSDAVIGQCPGFDYSDQCDPDGFDCTWFAIFGDVDCDGQYDICLICPPGTHPVDTSGDGCEDVCDCCPKIVCKPGFHAVDQDGDGCPETCVPICDSIVCAVGEIPYDSDDDGCEDMCLCGDAIIGQCPGFDYSDQCDPDGFDCTWFAIFGDIDCDGQYDVCIECPPGTHPVDTSGDGCEDVCDCCDPFVCGDSEIPYDSDDDGCPDLCLCGDAIIGQCPGFDYADQCLVGTFDCGPDGIFGDSNCDGFYDVCIACPPGTHPVDTSGDGCEDVCDCCPPLLCPATEIPYDSDGDGCEDMCVCNEAVFGQCPGFDYTDQCNPFGLDCGPDAILGDLDCNGQYEVCLLCPPGTIPLDPNGDGCEDLCGCCKPLPFACMPPSYPWDTNGDGCPDICKVPCPKAKIGFHCPQCTYDQSLCDPYGFDCGPGAILADPQCTCDFPVCLLCPPGTGPVDTNADGCEDMCDCPLLTPTLP